MPLECLPADILLIVCKDLTFHTKLNLAKTCRRLRYALYNTVLYEDIRIPKRHTAKALKYFQFGYLNGSSVRSCCIQPNQLSNSRIPDIATIFPNLKKLSYPYHDKPKDNEFMIPFRLRDTLEVCDFTISDHVFKLLGVFPFKNIRQLVLTDPSKSDPGYPHHFTSLTNAPSLTSLALCEFHVTLDMLENIHSSTTQLKRLSLLDCFVQCDEILAPEEIQPIASLACFQIMSSNDFFPNSQHLIHYFLLKYPNLNSLHLYNKDYFDIPRRNDPLYHGLTQLVKRLDDFRVNFFIKGEGERECSFEGRQFHMVFPTLISIHGMRYDLFSLYMETMVTTLALPVIYVPWIYHPAQQLSKVKTLKLFSAGFPVSFQKKIIKLNQLLFTYNQLEILDVENEYTDITVDDVEYQYVYPTLREIRANVESIDYQGMFSFIRMSLPNITELSMSTVERTKSLAVILPEHDLSLLSLNVFQLDKQSGRWKYHYKIRTRESVKKFNYSHKGKHDVRVNHGLELKLFQPWNIDIVCKKLFRLKHNHHDLL